MAVKFGSCSHEERRMLPAHLVFGISIWRGGSNTFRRRPYAQSAEIRYRSGGYDPLEG